MARPQRTLGTLLRLALDALDGDVERAYWELGLPFRPRFTPITRLLAEHGPMRIKELADQAGFSHSAVSQTLSEMRRVGLVEATRGPDGRERIVHLSRRAEDLLPELRKQWRRTAAAVASLNGEIGVDLEQTMDAVLIALGRQSFGARMGSPGAH
ncbi:MAG TPA: MarR family transcriptional regulator [Sphingomicrobium sp.]